MGSRSKPFDIYKGPESDVEKMKPLATKPDRPSMKRINTKTNSETGLQWVGDRAKSENKARPRRKTKQSKLKKISKSREFGSPRKSARLEAKRAEGIVRTQGGIFSFQ